MAHSDVPVLEGEPGLSAIDGATRRPWRIAILSSQAFSLYNFRGPLIREIVRRGAQVYALAPDFDAESRAALRALGAEPVDISMSRAGLNPLRDFADIVRLTRTIARLQLDGLLAYFIKPILYGTLAARIGGVRHRFALVPGLGYVFTEGGDGDGTRRRALRAIVALMYRAAFAKCDRVIFQNREDADSFVARGLDPRKVVRTNGTGVDLEEWKPVPLPTGPVVFLLVARLLKDKGIREYAEAARLLRQTCPDARCLLVGGVDANPSTLSEDEVRAWVDEGILEWAGQVTNVQPWIARAHVFVLPSYREGVPRSSQEAMAMGRAVITTDAIGCRETVIDGVNGFQIPVRNAAALAEAMRTLASDPSRIAEMGRASRRLVEERFDVRVTNRLIVDALKLQAPA